jgi:exodeoxyribonuclease VII small subunit
VTDVTPTDGSTERAGSGDASGGTAPGTGTLADEVAALGYEQARDELVDIVRRLESGSLTLEDSLRLWERGEALAERCQEWLAGARATIESARARRTADAE